MSRVVLVTGASRGIGKTVCEQLVSEGFSIAMGARTTDVLKAMAVDLRKKGAGVFYDYLDVSNEESVISFVDKAYAHFGRVDVLVNNAAVEHAALIAETDLEQAKYLMDVNFFGVLLCCKYTVEKMKSKGGHIITIGSEAGFRGLPAKGLYSASKFAVRGLMDALRMEVRQYNIQVSTLHPGYVDTDLHDHSRDLIREKGYATPKPRHTKEEIAEYVRALIHKPKIQIIPSWRGYLQPILALVAPWWIDRRTQKLFKKNNYEFY